MSEEDGRTPPKNRERPPTRSCLGPSGLYMSHGLTERYSSSLVPKNSRLSLISGLAHCDRRLDHLSTPMWLKMYGSSASRTFADNSQRLFAVFDATVGRSEQSRPVPVGPVRSRTRRSVHNRIMPRCPATGLGPPEVI